MSESQACRVYARWLLFMGPSEQAMSSSLRARWLQNPYMMAPKPGVRAASPTAGPRLKGSGAVPGKDLASLPS